MMLRSCGAKLIISRKIWTLPVPSTALLGAGPAFKVRGRREVGIRLAYEVTDGDETLDLIFEGVEAFKVTYYTAAVDWRLEAYDCLVEVGSSPWLGECVENVSRFGAGDAAALRHLMIYFDGGPCYEVICRGYRLERS